MSNFITSDLEESTTAKQGLLTESKDGQPQYGTIIDIDNSGIISEGYKTIKTKKESSTSLA